MGGYTRKNLKEDVEDQAPNFGLAPDMEARFANKALELEHAGISLQRLAPGARAPFGHRHESQEEVYVVVGGGGRMKLGDEEIEVRRWDAIRVAGSTMRAFEAGPDGLELLAYGAPSSNDVEMEQGWWGG